MNNLDEKDKALVIASGEWFTVRRVGLTFLVSFRGMASLGPMSMSELLDLQKTLTGAIKASEIK